MEATLELRKNLHGMWAAVAGGWGDHADYTDERAAAITERLLTLADLQPGERVLELASGPGGLGLAAAERVLPDGEVVLSDVVAEMTAIAAERAQRRGLTNVSTEVLYLEQIDQPDSSYDAVLCREGLMFAVDPAQAAREIGRVLRPGGRVALAVWGPRDRNPWLGVVLDSVSAQLGAPIPPPGIPGPFALEDADKLAAILSEAGLGDVAVDEQLAPLKIASFDEWWARTTALAGPLAKLLESLHEDAVEELRARAQEGAKPYETSAGLEFPGVTLVAFGRRP
jgi:enediyne biosynthesis protein CalE5